MRVQRYDFLLKVRPFAPAFNLYLNYFCKLLHYNLLAVLHVCRSIELSREVVVNSIVNLDIVD